MIAEATSEKGLRTLGIIPARGGSKGVPRKNIKHLAGRPLLEYTVASALQVRGLARVIVSTDDQAIADCALACGADVPFLRPATLAQDGSPTVPVLQHAVFECERTDGPYDAICLLQPTCPFRSPGLVDRCLERLVESAADTVMTVEQVPHSYHPDWVFVPADGTLRVSTGLDAPTPRRQDLSKAFARTGSVYVVRRDTLMKGNTLYGRRVAGVETPQGATINIDTLEDWQRAEERALEESGRA